MLSNGNMFLPLSNLNVFQRLALDPATAPEVLAAATPEVLAAGMGENTFTPPRSLEDPAIAALAHTFAFNDGIAVLHDTIQYLVERSEHEQEWLEALAAILRFRRRSSGVSTTSSRRCGWPRMSGTRTWPPSRADNEFWLLPRANHYLQHDQPQEFVEVVDGRSVKAFSGGSRPALRRAWGPDPGGSLAGEAALRQRGALERVTDSCLGRP